MARPISHVSVPALPPVPFFVPLADVPALLEASLPRPTARLMWPLFGAVWVALFAVTAVSDDPVRRASVQVLTWTVTLAMVIVAWIIARSFQDEIRTLARVDDWLYVGRDQEAALALHVMMSRPMRTEDNRVRALAQLASALARLNRTEDALLVYDAALKTPHFAGLAGAALKLERTWAVLKNDHLYDADRGIVDLRRLMKQWNDRRPDFLPPRDGLAPGDHLIAGVKLLEIYRDVKTGHAEEALAVFDADLPLLRAALGHRLSEAYALAALAHEQLLRPDTAAEYFAAATTLKAVSELVFAYPELRAIAAKYPFTLAPAELACGASL